MPNKALLIIDVQNGMFQRGSSVYQDAKLLYNLKKIAAIAKAESMPIFYIQHESDGSLQRHSFEWQLHPFLHVERDDEVIYKKTPDAFYQTNLEEKLHSNEIKELIVTGIQTDICVDTTCRSAFSKGFSIELILDAHSTWDNSALSANKIIQHHNQTLRWFSNTLSTDEFVERLR